MGMNDRKRDMIEKVYRAIQSEEITRNGMLLPERELAERFRVTRSYMRDVLISLETLGVIDIRERQGIFVGGKGTHRLLDSLNLLSVWPVDAITQVFELRTMIEGPTASFAAQRRDERDIAAMRRVMDHLAELRERKAPDMGIQGVRYNAILHTAIVQAAHNQVLIRIYEGTSRIYTEGITSIGHDGREQLPYEKWPDQVFEEHHNLVEAIRESEPERARDAAVLHLENSRDRIQGLFRR